MKKGSWLVCSWCGVFMVGVFMVGVFMVGVFMVGVFMVWWLGGGGNERQNPVWDAGGGSKLALYSFGVRK
jgi:hypothetical protein